MSSLYPEIIFVLLLFVPNIIVVAFMLINLVITSNLFLFSYLFCFIAACHRGAQLLP